MSDDSKQTITPFAVQENSGSLSIILTGAETEALLELASGPWEVWTEGRESHIADMVLRTIVARGMATIERKNSTLHRFEITKAGLATIAQAGASS